MPVTRKLYTLQEVKELIAKENNVTVDQVDTFENILLHTDFNCGEEVQIKNDSFLFQADVY